MLTHSKETPLFFAAERGDRKMVEWLMDFTYSYLLTGKSGFRILCWVHFVSFPCLYSVLGFCSLSLSHCRSQVTGLVFLRSPETSRRAKFKSSKISRNLLHIMFISRYFGRTLLAAAKSETSTAAAAATSTARTGYNPLEEFFEVPRSAEDDKPMVYGRSWKASELRLKSWDDLNKLGYVLLKEKNMRMSQRQMLHAQNLRFPNPERLPKVRKSMCRIKHVLTERAIEEPDSRRSTKMKRMVNPL